MSIGSINLLDISTINKIAAGEVVERPFSVVKELVENSIDAKSSKVTVEIKDGGVSFIRVSDNGIGIPAGEIEAAFLNHATSKISALIDLNTLETLGFRGEALASIAAVSQLEVTSKTAEQYSGVHIEIFGGEILGKREAACNTGTIVTMRNLFYNTPARKKFLKSVSAETGYISDFMSKIALSRPDISFRFINNEKESLFTSGNADLKTAVFSVYGADYAEKSLSVEFERAGVTVRGFIAKPELSRANRSMEDIFVNGRYIKDKTISKAAEDACRTYLTINRFPAFVLFVCVDPKEIDVNAHPQKLEIRFSNDEKIYGAVNAAVSDALKSGNLIRSVEWGRAETVRENKYERAETVFGVETIKDTISEDGEIHYPDVELRQLFSARYKENFVLDSPPIEMPNAPERLVAKAEKFEQPVIIDSAKMFTNYRILGQAFSTYWIIEENSKLFLIDQHAAHERILYEKAKSRLLGGDIVIQALVAPEKLRLTEREKGVIADNIEHFKTFGFEIEQLKDDGCFYLKGLPMLISAPENTETLKQLIDMFSDGFSGDFESDLYEIKIDALAKIACKAAVKANDSLSADEARAVIKALLSLDNPFTCPHGRPTIIEMTKYDLELKFKRA